MRVRIVSLHSNAFAIRPLTTYAKAKPLTTIALNPELFHAIRIRVDIRQTKAWIPAWKEVQDRAVKYLSLLWSLVRPRPACSSQRA